MLGVRHLTDFAIRPSASRAALPTAADDRRYLHPRPVTLALRGLPSGRYGTDAGDRRRLPATERMAAAREVEYGVQLAPGW